jgi:hypothetical protein
MSSLFIRVRYVEFRVSLFIFGDPIRHGDRVAQSVQDFQ